MTAFEGNAPDDSLMVIREVARLLGELHEREVGVSADACPHTLDQTAAALEPHDLGAGCPVGALRRELQRDCGWRQTIALRCYGEAGV